MSAERDAADLAVDLVNTRDPMRGDPELLVDGTALQELLLAHGRRDLAERVGDKDVRPARGVREQLRAAVTAPGEAEAVAILNTLVRLSGSSPQLVRDTAGWEYRFHDAEVWAIDVLAVVTATGLLDLVRAGEWSRVGLCEAPPCEGAYIDRSKNRSRRYCSDLCSDRVSQAAYRDRRRAASPGTRATRATSPSAPQTSGSSKSAL